MAKNVTKLRSSWQVVDLVFISRVFNAIKPYTSTIPKDDPRDYLAFHKMRLARAEEYRQFALQKKLERGEIDSIEELGQDSSYSNVDDSVTCLIS